METTRLQAASLILDRGVRFTIADAPFFYRLFRFNKIHIRPLRAGTLIEIAQIIDSNDLDKDEDNINNNKHLESICLLIAVSVLNSKWKINYLSGKLSKFLLWKVPTKVLCQIFLHIVELNKIADFTAITSYYRHQTTMMMTARLGQEKGS